MLIQCDFQILSPVIGLPAQIQMQYRIFRPVLFQFLNSQTLKKLLLALEIGFHRRNQQAFAETARTAKEIIPACRGKLVNQISLVHISETSFAKAFKILDSNRI